MVVEKGYKQTEIGVIPEDWEVIKLGQNFNLKARIGWQGLTTKEYLKSGDYSLVTGTDFENGYINWDKCVFVEKVRFDQDKNIQIKNGDVLVTKDGTIGKVAYINYIPNPTTLNSGVFVVRPNTTKINNRFFYYVLMSFYFDSYLKKITAGSTITHLYQKDFVHFTLILPPVLEQIAIANALSDMDALIAQTEKLIEKKKSIKQGAMQELLKPKEGWVTKKLGENSLILRGGSPRPIEDYLTTASDGINWIKIGDVGKNAKYITSTEEKITTAGMSRSRQVKPGDFLLSNSMSFGRPYIMQIDGCIHDGWLVISEYESNFDRDFLYYVLGSEAVLLQYKSMASGSSVLNLNKEIVKEVNIVCPKNLNEQVHIASVLSDIDIDLDFSESKLQKLKNQKQGMMQSLLSGKIRML